MGEAPALQTLEVDVDEYLHERLWYTLPQQISLTKSPSPKPLGSVSHSLPANQALREILTLATEVTDLVYDDE